MKRPGLAVLALLAALAAPAAPAAPPEPAQPRLTASEPRAFGYQVGDLVQREVVLHVPDGWQFDTASLPRPGARGQPLELRRVEAEAAAEPGGQRHVLRLDYQVFFAPPAVRAFELPSFRLAVRGPQRVEELLVEAWPVTVAPLVPVEVSSRRGLGELQPDRAPPLVDTAVLQRRLGLWAGAAALLLAGLALAYLGPPWLARRRRPFGLAWRALRSLPAEADAAQWRAACRRLHEALNHSAGEVLFEPGLERFVAAQPAFAPLRDELRAFLQRSRREFFGEGGVGAADARALVELARRCRDAERAAA